MIHIHSVEYNYMANRPMSSSTLRNKQQQLLVERSGTSVPVKIEMHKLFATMFVIEFATE